VTREQDQTAADARRPSTIGDYAFLSDSHSAAFVSRGGSVDWWAPPRFDAPAVFTRMLGPDAGHWQLRPTGDHRLERRYVGDTLVLRTTFETDTGRARVTDALALEPGARGHDIGRRSPQALLRRIEGEEGTVEFETAFAPRFEYGLTVPRLSADDRDIVARAGPTTLRLATDVALAVDSGVAGATFDVEAGDSVAFCLAYAPSFDDTQPAQLDVAATLEDTRRAWESWVELHQSYQGRYLDQVRRSAVVLRGLTYVPTGAIVAAATTSLPEQLGGDLNWDYRFSWLRDVSLTMRALWVAACPDEADRFLSYLTTSAGTSGGSVQIVYGLDGTRDLTEHTLDHLPGFADSRPVRVGNDAWKQVQLDVMGEVLDAAELLSDDIDAFDPHTCEWLVDLADRAAEDWEQPDAGMWESRDEPRHYLSSKVLCWAALDRAVKLADRLTNGAKAERWATVRDEIHRTVLDRGWNEEAGAYTGAFGSDRLDASVLLMPLIGFVAADDIRMRATIEAVHDHLMENGLVRRWDGDVGGFLICSYWLVQCLALAGEADRATALFEQISAYGNDLGLLTEMADPDTGEPLGNVPQAFSHVGLVNAAWRLTEATSGGDARLQPHD
jgi:GH15 family glucan-1,4-alpha-glucosidase